jgi:hypothetical protein
MWAGPQTVAEDLVVEDDPASAAHEQREEPELDRREVYGLTVDEHHDVFPVDSQVPVVERLAFLEMNRCVGRHAYPLDAAVVGQASHRTVNAEVNRGNMEVEIQ